MAQLIMFPPILESSQSAFNANTQEYKIYFTLPQTITSLASIGHIQIKVVDQKTNMSVVKIDTYPDGIIYKAKSEIVTETNGLSISVLASDLTLGQWTPGKFYKIQLRFGANALWSKTSEFFKWKTEQVNASAFSEWSTVMLTRAIEVPELTIVNSALNSTTSSVEVLNSSSVESSSMPLFVGIYTCATNELADKYKFQLYDDNDNLLEETDWLQSDATLNKYNEKDYQDLLQKYLIANDYVEDETYRAMAGKEGGSKTAHSHRFSTVLEENESYKVRYYVRTQNGYESYSKLYDFSIIFTYLADIKNTNLHVIDESRISADDDFLEQALICKEEGVIQVCLETLNNQMLNGNYVLTRTSEKTDYSTAEDLKYFAWNNKRFTNKIIFTDHTVESGVKYKYALHQENINGLRSKALVESGSPARYVNFEYRYLYNNGVQLKLKYNSTMNSFKHTQLQTKQDTMGSKYPIVFKNGYANYAEFPINGLLTLSLDENEMFFQEGTDGYYFQGKLVIPKDKYAVSETESLPDGTSRSLERRNPQNALTDNNIFVERKFRECAESWLQGNDYFLYRSPTEGNFIVTLTNFSMAPNEQLGRMIYSFSSTAYEVLECNLLNMNTYGIELVGSYTDLTSLELTPMPGQIQGYFVGKYSRDDDGNWVENTTYDSLIDQIAEDQTFEISGSDYQYVFESLKKIWVEQYPKLDFENDIININAKIAAAENEGEDTTELEAEKTYLETLQEQVEHDPIYPLITLIIQYSDEEKEINLGPNKFYVLEDAEDIQDIYLKYTGTLVMNYVCNFAMEENKSKSVISLSSLKVFGQMYGIFTDTESILNNYDYYRNYLLSTTGEPVSVLPEDQWSIQVNNGEEYIARSSENGKPVISGLYQSKDIFAAVEEQTRYLVENAYNTEFYQVEEEGELVWTDGSKYYEFDDILVLEIEADTTTKLMIAESVDDDGEPVNPRAIYIGPTEKYVLNPISEQIAWAQFSDPTFAIINFRCLTSITIKGAVE